MLSLILAALAAQAAPQPPVAVANSPPPPGAWSIPPSYPHSAAPVPGIGAIAIVRPPLAKGSLQGLVSIDDYPPSALARREQGRVAMLLDISEMGRVFACTVTASSGSSALDSTSCRLVRSRARFTPAADSMGMPKQGRIAGEIIWALPQG